MASGSGASVVADSVVGASVDVESLSLEQATSEITVAKAAVEAKIRRAVCDIGSPLGNSTDFRASISGTMGSWLKKRSCPQTVS
ncbi:unannotated protein [freshwater metagenome]|uniref:Unannotated protein n=1 Tax=freshwater metagenome TaxID=449393 RepID=A0A6J7QPM4_9ZZZZ